MKKMQQSFVLSAILVIALSLFIGCQPQTTSNNNSNTNHLDEYIKIQNEKEANAIRNANYSNLSTNELERRLKEGVKNVR